MSSGFSAFVLNAVISAIIGTVTGTFVAVYTNRNELRFANELAKQQARWEARFGSVREVKRTAGFLYEHLSGHDVQKNRDVLYAKIEDLNTLMSEFAEREEVASTIRDFRHTVAVRLAEFEEGAYYVDFDNHVKEMQAKFTALVQATESYLNESAHAKTKTQWRFLSGNRSN